MYISYLKQYMDICFSYAAGRLGLQEQEEIRTKLQEGGWTGCSRMFGNGEAFATQKDLKEAERAFLFYCRQQTGQGLQPYLEYLLERFALSAPERDCIRLLFVYEMDTAYAQAAALLQNGWGYVTPYLVWLLSDGAGQNNIQQDTAQFYSLFTQNQICGRFFLEPYYDEESVFCMRRLRLSKRMLDFACGRLQTDSCGHLLRRWEDEEALSAWIGQPDRQAISFLEQALRTEQAKPVQICYVYGETGSGRRFSIRHACREMGYSCCQVSLDLCMQETEQSGEKQKRRWVDGLLRELVLFQEIPVFVSELREAGAVSELFLQMDAFLRQAAEICPAVFLCMRQKISLNETYRVTYIHKKPLTLLEAKAYWEAAGSAYPVRPELEIGSMGNKFRLTPGMISRILENADQMRIQNNEAYVLEKRITEECYGVIARQMGNRAVKVPAVYRMEDLVLPARQKQQLLQICGQVRFKHKIYEEWGFQEKVAYGRGISAVFAGPPGTGKTMAAQVIAGELGMELYKVDLSCVVSKYVGETEKNLNEIFDQAEQSQVILLFDEADVLFGRRSEGKESTDKYSNLEAAFLLQKMEGYEGITILATNLFHHFDEAFKRRLKMVVEFPLPDEADRRQLWKTMVPRQMPAGEIDYDYLARRFELTGSNIRNILLHSAFLAAAKKKAVDMEEIIPAVKNEYAKNGKNLTRSDVSEYYMYLE